MADRKQTPDVLSQVLGGGPQDVPAARAPELESEAQAPAPSQPPPRTGTEKTPARQRSSSRRKVKPQRWEYLEVLFRDYGGLRPRFVNGEEQGWYDSVSGLVVVLGVADITNFAFYKIEYKRLMPGEVWHPISAGTQPVCENDCQVKEELGTWNTTLVTPGDYAFRLVVMDAEGNAPLPCEIQLRVLPPP